MTEPPGTHTLAANNFPKRMGRRTFSSPLAYSISRFARTARVSLCRTHRIVCVPIHCALTRAAAAADAVASAPAAGSAPERVAASAAGAGGPAVVGAPDWLVAPHSAGVPAPAFAGAAGVRAP